MARAVKRSISLPARTFELLEREADVQGTSVSAVLAEAADMWLIRRRGVRAVAEFEHEHGPFSADEIAAIAAELDRAAAELARHPYVDDL